MAPQYKINKGGLNMEWLPWIAILLQGVFCYLIGYRVGSAEQNDDLSEEAKVELKKYYWDHPINGKVEDD